MTATIDRQNTRERREGTRKEGRERKEESKTHADRQSKQRG